MARLVGFKVQTTGINQTIKSVKGLADAVTAFGKAIDKVNNKSIAIKLRQQLKSLLDLLDRADIATARVLAKATRGVQELEDALSSASIVASFFYSSTQQESKELLADIKSTVAEYRKLQSQLTNINRLQARTGRGARQRGANSPPIGNNIGPNRNTSRTVVNNINRIDRAARNYSNTITGIISRLGKFGAVLSGIAIASGTISAIREVGRAIGEVITLAADFERQISFLGEVTSDAASNLSNASGGTLADQYGNALTVLDVLRQRSLELGGTTEFTSSQVADLAKQYSKLGFEGKQILGIIQSTIDTATVSQEDLGATAKVVGETLRAFKLDIDGVEESTESARRVANVLAKAFSATALDLSKFSTAVGNVGAVAAATDQSLEFIVARLGTLINAGFDASVASTSLRNIFIRNGAAGRDYADSLREISEATNPLVKAVEFFGVRGGPQAVTLALNELSSEKLQKDLEQAGLVTSEFAEKAAKRIREDLRGQIDAATSAIERFKISFTDLFGASLTSAATRFASFFTKISTSLERLQQANLQRQSIEQGTAPNNPQTGAPVLPETNQQIFTEFLQSVGASEDTARAFTTQLLLLAEVLKLIYNVAAPLFNTVINTVKDTISGVTEELTNAYDTNIAFRDAVNDTAKALTILIGVFTSLFVVAVQTVGGFIQFIAVVAGSETRLLGLTKVLGALLTLFVANRIRVLAYTAALRLIRPVILATSKAYGILTKALLLTRKVTNTVINASAALVKVLVRNTKIMPALSKAFNLFNLGLRRTSRNSLRLRTRLRASLRSVRNFGGGLRKVSKTALRLTAIIGVLAAIFGTFGSTAAKGREDIDSYDNGLRTLQGTLRGLGEAFRALINSLTDVSVGLGGVIENLFKAFSDPARFSEFSKKAGEAFDKVKASVAKGASDVSAAFSKGFEDGIKEFDANKALEEQLKLEDLAAKQEEEIDKTKQAFDKLVKVVENANKKVSDAFEQGTNLTKSQLAALAKEIRVALTDENLPDGSKIQTLADNLATAFENDAAPSAVKSINQIKQAIKDLDTQLNSLNEGPNSKTRKLLQAEKEALEELLAAMLGTTDAAKTFDNRLNTLRDTIEQLIRAKKPYLKELRQYEELTKKADDVTLEFARNVEFLAQTTIAAKDEIGQLGNLITKLELDLTAALRAGDTDTAREIALDIGIAEKAQETLQNDLEAIIEAGYDGNIPFISESAFQTSIDRVEAFALIQEKRARETIKNTVKLEDELERIRLVAEANILRKELSRYDTYIQSRGRLEQRLQDIVEEQNALRIKGVSTAEEAALEATLAQQKLAIETNLKDFSDAELKKNELRAQLAQNQNAQSTLSITSDVNRQGVNIDGLAAQEVDAERDKYQTLERLDLAYNRIAAERALNLAQVRVAAAKEAGEGIFEAERNLLSAQIDFENAKEEEKCRALILGQEKQLEIATQTASLLNNILDFRSQTIQQNADRDIARVEDFYDRQIVLAEGNTEEQERLESGKEQEVQRIRERAFQKQKRLEISKALINAAQAILQVFASVPFPASIIAAAGVGVATASQISAIRAQTFADGGFTGDGKGNEPDHTGRRPVGVVHANEWVMPSYVLNTPEGRQLAVQGEVLRRKFGGRGHNGAPAKGFVEGGFAGINVPEFRVSSNTQLAKDTQANQQVNVTLTEEQTILQANIIASKMTEAYLKAIKDTDDAKNKEASLDKLLNR